jgi:TolA-binding protein
MFRRLCAFALLISPTLALGANKEYQELQRDVAQLQDAISQLRRSQDEKLAELRALVQQALNGSNDANKAVAVIQSNLQQSLASIETKVSTPVAGMNTRMDSLAGDMRSMQTSMSDLTGVINRMQTTLQDVSNQLKVIQTPAPAPPPAAGASAQPGPAAAAQPETPSMSAADLYAAAERDLRANRGDMALDEFGQFLKFYGNTPQAVDAQFYIGYIHFGLKDYQAAAKDFDQLLEKAPSDHPRVPGARYYKGMSLLNLAGHKTEAATEFKDLIKGYPKSDYSTKACDELKNLGLRCSAPAAAPKAGSKAAPKAAPKAGKKK